MTANILNGKALANQIISNLTEAVKTLSFEHDITPTLAVIMVGDNPASEHYVNHKERACKKIGIESIRIHLAADATFHQIQQTIQECADNINIHGILLQQPLPDRSMEPKLVETIPPLKDVDGFHPFNVGRLALRQPLLRPCTPFGVMQLLAAHNITVKGKHVVIVGASNIVGRPMALECLNAGATVTTCHRLTENVAEHVKQADICIVAIGNRNIIKTEWFTPGVVIVDVGFDRDKDGNIFGDVPPEAKEVASWITPVPGGVGAMTVATLMQNTVQAAKLQLKT